MNQFPQALYRAGGAELIDGRKFTSRMVHSAEELEAAQAEGFHATPDEAHEAGADEGEGTQEARTSGGVTGQSAAEAIAELESTVQSLHDENQHLRAALAEAGEARDAALAQLKAATTPAAPTRAELEAEAHRLGIEFPANLGDKKLAQRIADHKAAQGA